VSIEGKITQIDKGITRRQERMFDGYVIKKSTGEQIIISNPTPHFGFILQSAFK
jgi:hypothetical protein